jgi:hypothetical protein
MPHDLSPWDLLDDLKYQDERQAIGELLAAIPLTVEERTLIGAEATTLVEAARGSSRRQGVVESFLAEFSLGTREGLALMCLAEALLRTPDAETRDRLIAEKIGSADWASHAGRSGCAAIWRRGPFRHRAQGRRPKRVDALCRRARGLCQHHHPGWRSRPSQSLSALWDSDK